MPRPFLVLGTSCPGLESLATALGLHPDVAIRSDLFFRKGEEMTDDERIRGLRRFWAPFRGEGERRSRGTVFRTCENRSWFTRPLRLVRVAREYDPAVVVLRHDDLATEAIAALLATGEAAADAEARTLSTDSFVTEVRNLRRRYAQLDVMVEAFGPVLEIAYQDLVDEPEGSIRLVLRHVGAEAERGGPMKPAEVPGPDDLASQVANFDEVMALARSIAPRQLF